MSGGLKHLNKGQGLAATVIVLIFALDQALKWWLLLSYDLALKGRVAVLPFFDLVLVWNRGISYGLFAQDSHVGRYILIAIMLSVTGFLLYLIWRGAARHVQLGYGLIAGGALGNVLDRLVHGAVVDYALLYWRAWQWYVFNLADVAIVAGVCLLVYDSFKPAKA